MVVLRMKGYDAAEDGLALVATLCILGDDTGTNLDAHPKLQHSFQDRASGHATFQLIHLSTGLVDIERTNDDEPRIGREVAYGNRDSFHDVLVHSINVVF